MLLCSVEQSPLGAGTSKYETTTQASHKVVLALLSASPSGSWLVSIG